jgi:flagellar basal body-associated protein FliL
MAAGGSLISEFVSQNAIILIIAVVVTALVLAVSTYYIGRNFMSSNSFDELPPSQESDTTAVEREETENKKPSSASAPAKAKGTAGPDGDNGK